MSGTATGAADRGAIMETIARIAWAMDEGHVEELTALMVPGARLRRMRRSGEDRIWLSPDGVAALIEDHRRVAAEDRQTWTTDAVVTPVGDGADPWDAVSVVSSSLRVATLAGGTSNVLLGDDEVHDLLVRTSEGWRLASRTVVPLGVVAPSTPVGRPVPPCGPGDAGERAAVEALFADYAWALDTADIDAVLGLFSEDAVMQDPFGRFTGLGPDGIRRFFEGLFARPEFAGRIHWVSQLVLTPTPTGYRADSYALVPAAYADGAVSLHLVAFYRDEIVREGGTWRFRERLVGARWPREIIRP